MIEILLFKDIDFQMVYSKIRFFTSWMDSSGESRDTCFFVNYKRGLTLPKTELDSILVQPEMVQSTSGPVYTCP